MPPYRLEMSMAATMLVAITTKLSLSVYTSS